MAIKSDAFSRVILTGEDAKKFKAQATYGRAKPAAKAAAKKGVKMSRDFTKNGGKLRIKLTPAKS